MKINESNIKGYSVQRCVHTLSFFFSLLFHAIIQFNPYNWYHPIILDN